MLKQTQLDYCLCSTLKLAEKIPEKLPEFCRHFLSVCQNRNISQTKNRVSLNFRNKACKDSWWAAGEHRLPGPLAPKQPHHTTSPLPGTAATPAPAASRPTGFLEVAGPSSLSCEPKSCTARLAFQLSSRKSETFENSAYAQALKPWETLLWASRDSLWHK